MSIFGVHFTYKMIVGVLLCFGTSVFSGLKMATSEGPIRGLWSLAIFLMAIYGIGIILILL